MNNYSLPAPLILRNKQLDFKHVCLMGVLNLTPDSFSDGGEYTTMADAHQRAHYLATSGAHLLDIGGASSHPRAKPVTPTTELSRVADIVEQLACQLPIPISIDTQTLSVAEHCLKLGAQIINDVSGFSEPEMASLAAEYQVPLVLTYNNLRHPLPPSSQLIEHMLDFFQTIIRKAQVAPQLIIDPGYGFGKTPQQNVAVIKALPRLKCFGLPLLVCTSRKASLASITVPAPPKARLGASIASGIHAVRNGANLLRVHDVFEHKQALLWQQH